MTSPRVFVTAAMAAVVLSSSVTAQTSQAVSEHPALREFARRVAAYVELRHTIVATLPPVPTGGGAVDVTAAVDRIREAIQFARLRAHRGDLFVPEVAPVFRALIRRALADDGIDPRELVADAKADMPPHAPPVLINQPFPPGRQPAMAVCLLAALPSLPVEVQYRLDGRTLVLVDVTTRLVLDVLPGAVPRRPDDRRRD